jgi:hypothetical protein
MQRILACLLVVSACAYADTLRLKSGRTVEGTYLGGDTRNLRFDTGERVQTFSINDVAEIQFGDTAPSNSAASTPSSTQSQDTSPALAPTPAAPAGTTTASARAARASDSAELPQGTPLVLRLIDDVDSTRDAVGQTFRASIDEPVVVGERTIIARGADVVVKLVEDKQSGKLTGRTELTLDVQSVMVNGRMIDVHTDEVTQASASRTGKTGTVVGGTAALGAIIGAIAGGGKGAAIGAVSGAAAGGAVQVMTKGEKVKIPSETRLTFTLQQPLRI